MKKLLLLWLMIAPMSGMAQNESTPQDTTLYVNGRKIVIKEQGDKKRIRRRYDNKRANLRRGLPERAEYGKPYRAERSPLLEEKQQEKQVRATCRRILHRLHPTVQ